MERAFVPLLLTGHRTAEFRGGARALSPVSSQAVKAPKRRQGFPWLALIVFLGTVYLFWILPYQLGDKPVDVEFSDKK